MNGSVYRAVSRDKHGDAVGVEAVGEITGLILGAQAVESTNARGHVVSTEGLVGVPTDSAVQLQHDDVLVTDDGQRYRVSGPRLWDRPHSLTGTLRRYAWITVTALTN